MTRPRGASTVSSGLPAEQGTPSDPPTGRRTDPLQGQEPTMHMKVLLRRRLALVVAGLTALALPVAIGQSASASSPAPVTWHVMVGTETPDMAVSAMAFLPREVWIDKGDTVRWTAGSAEPHTVTFLAPGTTLPEFDPFNTMQTTLQ